MPIPIIIATIMHSHGDTGVQTHFNIFKSWLCSNKYPVELITPFSTGRWSLYPIFAIRRILQLFNKSLSVWWYRYWHTLFLFNALQTVFSTNDPCIVYAQCPLSADAALRARKSVRQRVILVVHFNISQADEWVGKGDILKNGSLYRSIRQFECDVLPKLDGLVCVSEFMQKELSIRIHDIEKIPYKIIPNFLPDPLVTTRNSNFEADLITIGTLETRKNQRYALEIIAELQCMGRPLHLTIVGDGPDRKMLEGFAKQLGIQDQVFFAGYLANASASIPKHRFYLHVAEIENLPITLIESLSWGVPIFATPVGGVTEIFNDNIEGRYLPSDDARCAAKKILEWIDSDELRINAGIQARNRFLARFEVNNVANSLLEFLHNLAH